MFYILICFITIFYASRVDLMYENLTGALMLSNYHNYIILHIILCAVFFAYKTNVLYQLLPISTKSYTIIIKCSAIMMILGAFFPYTLNGQDIFSQLHVYCTMIPCLSFLILLFIYNRLLSLYFPSIYQKVHLFYDCSLQVLGILIVVLTRVNGYIEILFSLIVCYDLFLIENHLKKIS